MGTAFAHSTAIHAAGTPGGSSLLAAWTLDPALLPLGLCLVLYVRGFMRGRRRKAWKAVRWTRLAAFGCGSTLLLLSLCSPLDALADTSFTWHMLQHMLLSLAGAPLLLLGAPFLPLAWGLPGTLRRHVLVPLAQLPWLRACVRALFHPAAALGGQIFALGLWHLPFFYDLALRKIWAHWGQHLHFTCAALIFWWVIIQPFPFQNRLSVFLRIGLLFFSAIANAIVAALATFSPAPLYAYQYLDALGSQGALVDQQLGGGLMWVMGSMLHLAGIFWLFVLAGRAAQRAEPSLVPTA